MMPRWPSRCSCATALPDGCELTSSARIRVTRPSPAAPFPGVGDGVVAATTRALTRDGAPIFPVSGEIHYSRVPSRHWDDVLGRARAGGLTHVSSYVIWTHHEPVQGAPSFDADLDLRRFVDRARSLGLEIILRIGPYAHAEVRHGGLPDWLVHSGIPVRTNDPRYLAEVERWYTALATQLTGVPLFAIQVDNELYDRPEHLSALRAIAERVGLTAPLWTATAWGGARLPAGVLPSYGGYSDSFWIEASDGRDERSLGNFQISPRRDDDGIGADHREDAAAGAEPSAAHPFATCELGAGMVAAYHRRPAVAASDVEALALAKLASGSVWQGYYMYADGRNPRRFVQEAQAVGAPNDFAELGYDFGAPLSVDGAPRESWFRLRRQHLFLQRWGSALADMPATFPEHAADHPDTTRLRWSTRSDGSSGFVFVVNHQPHTEMPDHPGVTFTIERPEGIVRFPAVDIPSGAAFVWPFGLPIGAQPGAVVLAWATAQPMTEVLWGGLPLLVLTETGGIPFAFETDAEASAVEGEGPGRWWELRRAGAIVARMLVLTDADGLSLDVVDGRLVFDGQPTVAETSISSWRLARQAGPPPPGQVSAGGRAALPLDWSEAAIIDLELTETTGTVVIDWIGDVARAWDGDRLVSDALWNGREWRITAPERAGATSLRVEVLPAPPAAPVYFGVAPSPGAAVVAVRLGRADGVPRV